MSDADQKARDSYLAELIAMCGAEWVEQHPDWVESWWNGSFGRMVRAGFAAGLEQST